jgi:N-methylhydantoinase A
VGYTIDIDTGGTFTDGFFALGERVVTVKVPTTPHDLTVCFIECIRAGAERFGRSPEDLLGDTDAVRFSNTIGTNTIIQRDGSKVGLLVTSGRESLAPTAGGNGRQPLVGDDMVIGLDEETSDEGVVVRSPDPQVALAAAQELIDRGARCLVVAFANSEKSAENERYVQQIVKREYPRDYLGSVPVFLASNVSLRSGEAERLNAAVINAYIHAKLTRLLYKAGEDLRRRRYRGTLLIGHNNGAVARVAKTRAISTYNSGPAAGLLGARRLGELYGAEDLITADMGGTSFDLGYVAGGEATYQLDPEIEGFKVNVPMISIDAIGAGGGSIASVQGGELRVGPQSAGSLPGPAAFDLGGQEPTVTDADLVLGILDPGFFLGGRMKLNRDKAVAALEKIAGPLGVSVDEAALGVKRKVDEGMGEATRQVAAEVGNGTRPLLLVYGGAGPAHCCDVARTAGINRILITPVSAVFSAFGSSTLDVGHLYHRRVDVPFDADGRAAVADALAGMRAEAERDLRGEGYSAEEASYALELLVRNGGPEVRVTAPLPGGDELQSALAEAAQRAAEALGIAGPGGHEPLRLSVVGLRAAAPAPHYAVPRAEKAAPGSQPPQKGTRGVFLDEGRGREEVPVYDMAFLLPGHELTGPALVESEDTTLLVQRGWRLSVDQYRNCILEEAGR